MEGLVALIGPPYAERLSDLWVDLSDRFGVTASSRPHFSYHLAYQYGDNALAAMAQLAAQTVPFTVTTSGLGIFGGSALTLFLNVVRSPELSQIHRRLWDLVEPHVDEPHPANRYYRPEAWTPHITLGTIPDAETLGRVVTDLAPRDLQWEIPVDNIALLTDRTLPLSQLERWPLSG